MVHNIIALTITSSDFIQLEREDDIFGVVAQLTYITFSSA